MKFMIFLTVDQEKYTLVRNFVYLFVKNIFLNYFRGGKLIHIYTYTELRYIKNTYFVTE